MLFTTLSQTVESLGPRTCLGTVVIIASLEKNEAR
jgi:hypothetical protein